jgi:hypothetical protein
MSNHKNFGLARSRENKAMDALAEVVLGRRDLNLCQTLEDARQFGYLATLAKGAEYDRDKRLKALYERCRDVVAQASLPVESYVEAVDPVQASWGAPWHMDASKLRRELPLHVMKKQRASGSYELA